MWEVSNHLVEEPLTFGGIPSSKFDEFVSRVKREILLSIDSHSQELTPSPFVRIDPGKRKCIACSKYSEDIRQDASDRHDSRVGVYGCVFPERIGNASACICSASQRRLRLGKLHLTREGGEHL